MKKSARFETRIHRNTSALERTISDAARCALCPAHTAIFVVRLNDERRQSCDRSHYTTACDSLAHTTRQKFSVGDIRVTATLVMAPFTKQLPLTRLHLLHFAVLCRLAIRVSYGSQKCLIIVIGLLMRRAPCLVFHSLTLCDVDLMTAQTRSTVVGPIRF